jgi:hypothetical protein
MLFHMPWMSGCPSASRAGDHAEVFEFCPHAGADKPTPTKTASVTKVTIERVAMLTSCLRIDAYV